MFLYEGFKIGDTLRSQDFPQNDTCYIEGAIVDVVPKGTTQHPFAHYLVTVARDVFGGSEITGANSRLGLIMTIPMQVAREWAGRLLLIKYKVKPFGQDCMGNSSGYVVVGPEGNEMGRFVANLYVDGSHDAARDSAHRLAEGLNRGDMRHA